MHSAAQGRAGHRNQQVALRLADRPHPPPTCVSHRHATASVPPVAMNRCCRSSATDMTGAVWPLSARCLRMSGKLRISTSPGRCTGGQGGHGGWRMAAANALQPRPRWPFHSAPQTPASPALRLTHLAQCTSAAACRPACRPSHSLGTCRGTCGPPSSCCSRQGWRRACMPGCGGRQAVGGGPECRQAQPGRNGSTLAPARQPKRSGRQFGATWAPPQRPVQRPPQHPAHRVSTMDTTSSRLPTATWWLSGDQAMYRLEPGVDTVAVFLEERVSQNLAAARSGATMAGSSGQRGGGAKSSDAWLQLRCNEATAGGSPLNARVPRRARARKEPGRRLQEPATHRTLFSCPAMEASLSGCVGCHLRYVTPSLCPRSSDSCFSCRPGGSSCYERPPTRCCPALHAAASCSCRLKPGCKPAACQQHFMHPSRCSGHPPE